MYYEDDINSPKVSYVKRQKIDLKYATELLMDVTNSTNPYDRGVFYFGQDDVKLLLRT